MDGGEWIAVIVVAAVIAGVIYAVWKSRTRKSDYDDWSR